MLVCVHVLVCVLAYNSDMWLVHCYMCVCVVKVVECLLIPYSVWTTAKKLVK